MASPDPQRRNSAAHAAILEAAWQEVIEKGHARLTVEGIAKRAGVGKQTLYRWWSSKEAVLLEALDSRVATTLDFPDSGDIVTDLGDQIAPVAEFLSSEDVAPYRALLAASQSDPELAHRIRDQVIKPRADACVQRLEKAKDDGQLRADVDPLDVVELLFGTLYYRLVLHTGPLNAAVARAQIHLVFDGLKPRA